MNAVVPHTPPSIATKENERDTNQVPEYRKTPWRISQPQKARQRKRLRSVDRVVDTLSAALQRNGQSTKAVERWYAEMPREEEMVSKDKYTIFDKKEKMYRKGLHSMYLYIMVLRGDANGVCARTAQVDTSEPARQPSGFLNGLSITAFDCWMQGGCCRRYECI